jgi:CRISPR-associated exonuclease Cas4
VSESLETIPISAIEHYAYCPRQCALIHVDDLWSDNVHTVRGAIGHRRVDDRSRSRSERGRLVLRAVPLWSESLELTGRADVIEVEPDGRLIPVEYKMGHRHGDAADLQLCAQALCLEEMTGAPVREGALWFGEPRRRITVNINDQLRRATRAAIEEIRALLSETVLPAAVNDGRCRQCQLRDRCLPEVVADSGRIPRYLRDELRCSS